MALNHRTKRWIGIEYSSTIATLVARLDYWRTENGNNSDYKIVVVPDIPS